MNEKQILREAMKATHMSQQKLAEGAGYKTQSHIANILMRPSMRVDVFVKLLNAMGCELLVRSRNGIELPGTKGDKYYPEWVVDEPGKTEEHELGEDL